MPGQENARSCCKQVVLNARALLIILCSRTGVTLNFFLDAGPDAPGPLFAGGGLAVVALMLCTAAHIKNERGHQTPLQAPATTASGMAVQQAAARESTVSQTAIELPALGGEVRRRHLAGAERSTEPSEEIPQRAITRHSHATIQGLAIAICGGTIYSLYTASFNLAINDQFGVLPRGVKPLSIYSANFYFAIGLFLTALVVNCICMRFPPLSLPQSSMADYFRDNKLRPLRVAAGVLSWTGDGSQFMGGQLVGFASAMMVQAYPMVSTVLGILVFKEFFGCCTTAKVLLSCSIATYLASIALLVYAGLQT